MAGVRRKGKLLLGGLMLAGLGLAGGAGCGDDEQAGPRLGAGHEGEGEGEGEGSEGEGEGGEGEGEGGEGEGEGSEGEGEGEGGEGEGEGAEGEGEGGEGEGEGGEGEGEGGEGEGEGAEGEGEGAEGEGEGGGAPRWYRGNLHTHSWPTSFDCNTPEREHTAVEVADWFRSHGWSFVVFTEHDAWEPRERDLSTSDFLVIDGLELTSGSGLDSGVHVGAFDLPGGMATPGSLTGKIDATRAAGAMPVLHHPEWSLEIMNSWGGDEDLAVEALFAADAGLVEIWNTHTETWDSDPQNDERIWDRLLSRGKRIYGVASDDSHGFEHIGGSWVEVWAPELAKGAIRQALSQGRFYASTGVKLHRLVVRDGTLEVLTDGSEVQLLGPGEQLLASADGGSLSYALTGEAWVRVRATRGSDVAWSQPLWAGEELELGAEPAPPLDEPRGPRVIVVQDTGPGNLSSFYPGADINEVLALLPDGTLLRPTGLVDPLTHIADPAGQSLTDDPADVLDDGLVCGPDWAGFTSLGGPGGQVAVRFAVGLPVGTRVRVVEVDPAVCATANSTPEPWLARSCWGEQADSCVPLGRCDRGGVCEFLVGEAQLRP